MKLLWADINASYSHSNLAFPAMEAQMPPSLRAECEWEVVGGTLKSPQEELVMKIANFKPQYIFATAWLFNIEYLLSVIEKSVILLPGTKVILGGPEFLGDNSDFLLKHPFVTAVFRGEGEEVFPLLISSLLKCRSMEDNLAMQLKEIPGIEYISDGKYIRKSAVRVKNFAGLNPPESSRFFNWQKPFVQIETSRGCFNSCRFCVSGRENPEVENIEIDTIEKRIGNILSHGIKEIRILDRTFNGNAKRATGLIELFRKFHGSIKFHIEIHPAFINENLTDRLKKCGKGVLHVEAGLQSLDNEVIKLCNRKGEPAAAIKGLKRLLECGNFEVHTDLIAGLPGYSYVRLLSDVKELVLLGADEIQLELLKLLPGTCFREKSPEFGIRYSPRPPYEVLSNREIGYTELYCAKILSKILEYWYNDPLWRDFTRTMVAHGDDYLEKLIAYLDRRNFLYTVYSLEGKSILLHSFCKALYPGCIGKFTLYWVRCGLSLKKEPASLLKRWWPGKEKIPNPIYERENPRANYYLLENDGLRYWFMFDYTADRHRPVKEGIEKL